MSDYGVSIFPQHAKLLAESAVSVDVARARGYVSVDTKRQLEAPGFSKTQRNTPGLLIPVHGVTGDVVLHQYRPDTPRVTDTGKAVKYETPSGSRMALDVPPHARGKLGDPNTPLWITEGARKADAAVSAGLCCVALLGVANWRGSNGQGGKTALACWHEVALNDGRPVFVCFDSDVMTKDAVRRQLVGLKVFLESRGARVRLCYLPAGDNGAKVGLDDYLAAGGTADELVKTTRAEPLEPDTGSSFTTGEETPKRPPPEPRTLADVEATYRRWFAGDDLVPLHAALAAYVANEHLAGDPVWVMLVGGSGRGKTEIGVSLAALDHVAVKSTITGPAALLSGTAKRERAKDATGGLLRVIGEHGVLVLKDFTSIIGMHRDARAEVVGALRECYDGQWSRDVGSEGGRTLSWSGKLGIVGCCTSVIDDRAARTVMASMGDRFLFVRMPDDSRADVSRQSLRHASRERQMRTEMAGAVAGLMTRLGEPHAIDTATEDALVDLADLVSLARSPIERDHQGEIDLVLDAEAPTRVVKALAQAYRACGRIGLDTAGAWQVVTRLGIDSIPKLRRAVLEHLAEAGSSNTSQVATNVAHPTMTTKRALEDLTAHGVVHRISGGSGKADLWQLPPHVEQAWKRIRTSPELSDKVRDDAATGPSTPSQRRESKDSLHAYDDTSGEVPSPSASGLCPICETPMHPVLIEYGYTAHPMCEGEQE